MTIRSKYDIFGEHGLHQMYMSSALDVEMFGTESEFEPVDLSAKPGTTVDAITQFNHEKAAAPNSAYAQSSNNRGHSHTTARAPEQEAFENLDVSGDMSVPVPLAGASETVDESGDNTIDSLAKATRWSDDDGNGVTVTYSFGSSSDRYDYPSDYNENGISVQDENFAVFSETQKDAARLALQKWADVADITFVEVEETDSEVGDIRFAISSDPISINPKIPNSSGYAMSPGSDNFAGDIWISTVTAAGDFSEGTFGFATLMHEIGHAIGLEHPHDSKDGDTAPSFYDWIGYSVMSYSTYEGDDIKIWNSDFFPTTPMLNDIKAAQYLYGANTSHNAGNTNYIWAPDEQIFEAIYDAGGVDTLNWANQTTDARINLNPGTWNELGPGYDSGVAIEDRTMMIADNTWIENAIGGSGNDNIQGNRLDNTLLGGDGTDVLEGLAGNDKLFGGRGVDTLYGNDGADHLYGGTERDTLIGGGNNDEMVGGQGADTLIGGAGVDTAWYHLSPTAVTVSLLAGTGKGGDAEGDTLESIEGVVGSNFSDRLYGDAISNRLYGGAGDDVLDGGSGGDRLDGGEGNDTATYQGARDGVWINLDAGNGFGNGLLGDSLNDRLFSIENVTGSNYNDWLFGDEGANVIEALDGVDFVRGGRGQDMLYGGAGVDTLYGDEHSDWLYGEDGNDYLYGNGGTDHLYGGNNNDILDGGAGSDFLHGGGGRDYVSYGSAQEGVIANLDMGEGYLGDAAGDRYFRVENLSGSEYGDTLIGNDRANVLRGKDGIDVLVGGGGADRLAGGFGNDRLTGGAGQDTFVFERNNGNDTVTDFESGFDIVLYKNITPVSQSYRLVDNDMHFDLVVDLGIHGSVTFMDVL